MTKEFALNLDYRVNIVRFRGYEFYDRYQVFQGDIRLRVCVLDLVV